MSSLMTSRWAATPPVEDGEKTEIKSDIFAPRWAETSPPPEPGETEVLPGIFSSRWADTPPPTEPTNVAAKDDEGVERLVENDEDPVEHTSTDAPNEAEVPPPPPNGVSKVAATEEGSPEAAEEAVEDPNDLTERIETPVPAFKVDEIEKIDGAPDEDARVVPVSPTKSRLEAPRMKRKVSWNGKTCIISIPNLDYDGLGLTPLSVEEVQSRLKHFEDAGYDTAGFSILYEQDVSDGPVHVKPIYPDEAETRAVILRERAQVRLPDLQKWRAYEDWLREQKLAALGVTLDEPTGPPSQEMSRQSSVQFPSLPFSPPISSNSAGSVGRPGMVRGHSHAMSVASPISPLNGPFGHMHRHSTVTGPISFHQLHQHAQQSPTSGMRAFSPQIQIPQHQQMPGLRAMSPQNQFAIPAFNRVASPNQLSAVRNEFGPVRGPGSPLAQQVMPQSAQDYSRHLAQDQLRRQQGFSPQVQQPVLPNFFNPYGSNVQPTPTLPELPEEDDEEDLLEKQDTEPQGASKDEPEPPAYVPPHKRAQINANIATPTPLGHHHNISEGLEREILEAEQRREADRRNWIEVEEDSVEESSKSDSTSAQAGAARIIERDPLSQDLFVQEANHSHKKSLSRNKVAAPSFKFNPGANFQPASSAFTFGAPSKPVNQPFSGHSRQKSSGAFNAAAPEFKPAGLPSLPKSEFSFSSNGPSFKPNAPSFQPSTSRQVDAESVAGPIFGRVEIPDIIKPARRSKAVEILPPKDSGESMRVSASEKEDEDGRILQSEDRIKRQRKADDDGDEVPKFAEPTPMPAPVDLILKSQPTITEDQPVDSSDGADRKHNVNGVQDFANSGPESVDDAFDHDFDRAVAHTRQAGPGAVAEYHRHKPSSSLSALAKPFEPFGVQKPATYDNTDDLGELEEGELREDDEPGHSSERDLPSDRDDKIFSPLLPSDHPASARVDTVLDGEPSFAEIDAVMRQLNSVDEGRNAPQSPDISPLPSPGPHIMDNVTYLPEWHRSDAPSPSPRRQPVYNPDSSYTIHERTDSGERAMNGWAHVNQLNKAEDVTNSDWSGLFSAQDEEKLQARGRFFDSHIDDLIGKAVEKRLQPLEESLRSIHHTINKRPTSRDLTQKRSSSAVDSDADDEDDMSDGQHHRPISRGRDKRADQVKAAVLEALREQSPRAQQHSQPSHEVQELHSILADMKTSFARAAAGSLELEDIRAVVQDIVGKQQRAVSPVSIDNDEKSRGHKREMSELEGRLNETLAGALDEANLRRAAEEREAESRRMLRLAEDELQTLRQSSRETESRVTAIESERNDLSQRVKAAEESQRKTSEHSKNLEAENAATYATLEEYRTSSKKWRQEIDDGLRERQDLNDKAKDLQHELEESKEVGRRARHDVDRTLRERDDLESTMARLERQLEESHESGSSMRRRLEKLHSDMAAAVGQLASEKSTWKTKEEEYRSKCDSLEAQVTAHFQSRSRLEEEVRTLRTDATDASERSLALDQLKSSHSSLNELVRKLQADLTEQQTLAAQYQREAHEAREAGNANVQRVRASLEAEAEAAKHQANAARSELDIELSKVRAELEIAKTEAATTKGRYERILADESSARKEALQKATQDSDRAVTDAHTKHESTLQDLHAVHRRALDNAIEDKQRAESHLNDKLTLSDAKVQHFQDRVLHLEERLEVAKSAAQAAAMSAQSRGVPAVTTASAALPEKISPQALRESILVLQEQLQERESQVEALQHQVDNEGQAKLKARDDEIAWLRELLAVRSEDLTDLVNTLARPIFDRNAVRDTAIRIRANLQMEQQEKERFGQTPQTISDQAMASLSNFAAPKASQLSSAFAKWRQNMESSALKNAPRGHGRPRSYTPSKGPNATAVPPGYASGLMTPPASNLRTTPSPEMVGSLPARVGSRPTSKSSHIVQSEPPKLKSRQASASSDGPTTPLFRPHSYDDDAEDSQVHLQSFEETIEDEDLDIADNRPPAFRSLDLELEAADDDESL